MSAGDKEMAEYHEEVATRNATAAIAECKRLRDIIDDNNKKMADLSNQIFGFNAVVAELRNQLANVQIKLYAGGTE